MVAISMCLVIALLGFGVYAALSVDYLFDGTISFETNSLFIDIDASVSGGNLASASTFKYDSVTALGNPTNALEWKAATTSSDSTTVNGSIASLNFEKSQSGKTITFIFKFTNQGPEQVTGGVTTTYPSEYVNQTISSSSFTLAPDASETITITYTLKSFGFTLENEALNINFSFND